MKNIAIKENHLYNKAYKRGKSFVGKSVAVYVLKDYAAERLAKANPEKKQFNRLGLSVSKKLGGAVTRNRVKRIIREGLRAVMREKELKTGFLIVIAARERVRDQKSADVARELSTAFDRLGLFVRRPDAK